MKNLLISLSLITTLLAGQTALAEETNNNISASKAIETIVVVAKPEVANFEVYSLEIAETAIDSALEVMVDNLSNKVANSGATLLNAAVNLGTSI